MGCLPASSKCEVQLEGEGPWQLPNGGDDLEIVFTPGHTAGMLSFLVAGAEKADIMRQIVIDSADLPAGRNPERRRQSEHGLLLVRALEMEERVTRTRMRGEHRAEAGAHHRVVVGDDRGVTHWWEPEAPRAGAGTALAELQGFAANPPPPPPRSWR